MPAGQSPDQPGISRIPPRLRYPGIWLAAIFCIALNLFAQIPSIWIQSVSFEGSKGLTARQLKGILRMSSEGKEYVAGNLAADMLRVEKAYQDIGYCRVKVGPPDVRIQSVGERKLADIRIPISEGPLYSVGKVAVRNVQVLGQDALMRMCPLKKGQPYSRVKSSQWQEKIEEAYHSMGYIRFRCAAREDLNEIDKTIDLTLECAEGRQYSVGKITLVADASIDRADFKRHLLLSEGGLFNPEMLSLSVQFLNQMRRYRPISNSDVEIRIDDGKGTVDLEWRLFLPQ